MKRVICTLLCLVMALSLAACGQKPAEAPAAAAPAPTAAAPAATQAPAAAPAKLSGTVSTDGSTSMEKVIGALGEAFMEANSDVTFTYNPTGSGSGIQAVQEGRCDIGLSSRALKDEEKAAGLTETVLCYDGIAVIVNPENTVEDLTLEQIAAIYTGEIKNWSEVGGADAEIVLIGREAGSGTRGAFEELLKVDDQCKYAQELDSTGVPYPFIVEYEILVDEPHALEQRVHKSLRAQREGRSVFYTLDDDHVAHMFEQGLLHVSE